MRSRIALLCCALALVITGCAGNRAASTACEPVAADLSSIGPVYRDCAVDRTAKPPAVLPSLQSADIPRQPSGCIKAVIEMVVDTTGRPVLHTAKVVESNDRRFEELVLSSLGSLRYTPAVKDNQKVAQLVRHERMLQFAIVAVPAGAPLPARPPQVPKC